MVFKKLCQFLEVLSNVGNQYFPVDQCMILQNYALVKDSFTLQDKSINFNGKEYECSLIWFQFHLVTNI